MQKFQDGRPFAFDDLGFSSRIAGFGVVPFHPGAGERVHLSAFDALGLIECPALTFDNR